MILADLSSTQYPEGPPATLYSGGLWAWKRVFPGLTYASYDLSYALHPHGGGAVTTVDATQEAAQFTVYEDGTQSPAAGVYAWRELLLKSGGSGAEVTAYGTVTVLPDPSTSTADPRTPERVVLDAINSLLAGKFTDDLAAITVRGRSLSLMSPTELVQLKSIYDSIVAAQEPSLRGASRILVEF